GADVGEGQARAFDPKGAVAAIGRDVALGVQGQPAFLPADLMGEPDQFTQNGALWQEFPSPRPPGVPSRRGRGYSLILFRRIEFDYYSTTFRENSHGR